ncbi:MAG: hypothetical protein ACRENP_10715 [Longimicrobiales bacterium]
MSEQVQQLAVRLAVKSSDELRELMKESGVLTRAAIKRILRVRGELEPEPANIPTNYFMGLLAQYAHVMIYTTANTDPGGREEAARLRQAVYAYVATLEHHTNPMQHRHAEERAGQHTTQARGQHV